MKSFTLLAFSCLLAFCGCKKSGTTPNSSTPSIIGKWSHTETMFQLISPIASPQITDIKYSDLNVFIQFNKDGTGVDSEGNSGSGSYTLTPFTYTFADSLLTLDENNNYQAQVVKEFTSTNLHTHYEFTYTSGGITATDIYDYFYAKQQ